MSIRKSWAHTIAHARTARFISARIIAVRSLFATMAALMLLAASPPALADYRYDFISNPFTVYGQPNRAPTLVSQEQLFVSILTSSPLTAGATRDNVLSFTIGLAPSETYFFYPIKSITLPFDINGCVCLTDGELSIGSLDENGLPLTWSISAWKTDFNDDPRHYTYSLTTLTQNITSSGNIYITGSGETAPGTSSGIWSVAVVPEPASGALLLAGVGLMGAVTRRRMRRPSTP